jgi:AraC family transcriptional regulator of adaptative response / DNA-3-methyladenine glycosylase II
VEYVAMRALGDPDAFPDTDLVLRRALGAAGVAGTEGWRPWRAYAAMHLWQQTTEETT